MSPEVTQAQNVHIQKTLAGRAAHSVEDARKSIVPTPHQGSVCEKKKKESVCVFLIYFLNIWTASIGKQ